MKRCPKCKGTRFSVEVVATEIFDGETGVWSDVEVYGNSEKEDAFFCLGCESTFRREEDLEEFK